jgi:hypothetical protein
MSFSVPRTPRARIYLFAPNGCLIDVKSILDPEEVRKAGTPFWRL